MSCQSSKNAIKILKLLEPEKEEGDEDSGGEMANGKPFSWISREEKKYQSFEMPNLS